MPVLSRSVRNRVIPIGHPIDEEPGSHFSGTGFLYGWKSVPDAPYRVLAVTNRHNLEGIGPTIRIRVNPAAGGAYQQIDIPSVENGNPTWRGHPDQNVDVAVFDPRLPQGFVCDFFRGDQDAADVDRLNALDVSEGDPAFAVGYPLGLGVGQNSPVVRGGCIAEVSEARAGVKDAFLVDVTTTSGTTVVLHTAGTGMALEHPPLLLGVLHAYFPIDIEVHKPQAFFRFQYRLNTGMTRVLTVDRIEEAIAHYLTAFGE